MSLFCQTFGEKSSSAKQPLRFEAYSEQVSFQGGMGEQCWIVGGFPWTLESLVTGAWLTGAEHLSSRQYRRSKLCSVKY